MPAPLVLHLGRRFAVLMVIAGVVSAVAGVVAVRAAGAPWWVALVWVGLNAASVGVYARQYRTRTGVFTPRPDTGGAPGRPPQPGPR